MTANEWNKRYTPGEAVIVTLDDGSKEYTKTRGPAVELGNGEAVVPLRSRTGGYLLDRVQAVSAGGTNNDNT